MGCGATKVAPASQDTKDEKLPSQGVLPEAVQPTTGPSITKIHRSVPSVTVAPPSEPVADKPVEAKLAETVEVATKQKPAQLLIPIRSRSPIEANGGRSPKQTRRVQKHNFDSNSEPESPISPISPRTTALSQENRQFLNKVLQRHFLFSALEDEERNDMIDFMEHQKTPAGSTVFQQGDRGDGFYVIQKGTFSVAIDHSVLKQLKPKHTFGELALLYNVSRTATISCSQDGSLWRLDERAFKHCMETLSTKHHSKVRKYFDSDKTFSALTDEEKDKLAGLCSVQTFHKGETILREGEVGDWMFIVIKGSIATFDQLGNPVIKHPGTILGISGLMYTGKQILGAKAVENVTCIAIGKSLVERLVGPVEHVLRRCAVKTLVMDNWEKNRDLDHFKLLSEEQRTAVFDQFEDVYFEEGEVIARKGAPGCLHMIIEGDAAAVAADVMDGMEGTSFNKEHKEKARKVLSTGATHGSKPFLDNAEMTEYLVALSPGRLYRISSEAALSVLKEPLKELIRLNEIKKVLSEVFLFKNLSEDQVNRTIRALKKKRYAANEVVVRQGDDAKHFFLIKSGVIKIMKDGEQLRTLGKWDYFGERGLLLQEKRSASCMAESECSCLVLEAASFKEIVAMFEKSLIHRMKLQDLNVAMTDLRLQAICGRGTFGVVKLVKFRDDKDKVYALKCVLKEQVVRQNQQKGIITERDINAQCYHPCIVQFIKTFADSKYIYFLTEFLGGGDLFYAIREIGDLSKAQVHFYSASITLALEHLHGHGIMYRDLKPENVMLSEQGHCKLTDFGCCKKAARSNTIVGTPEYLAPEVILGKGYTYSVDWWALGVMVHEFIVGPLPFGRDTDDQLELFREILEVPLEFPRNIKDEHGLSLISGLLDRSPELRIGGSSRGSKEIQEHRYLAGFDWVALAGQYMTPPWKPNTIALRENWEVFQDDPLVAEGEKPYTKEDALQEPGMEWSAVF